MMLASNSASYIQQITIEAALVLFFEPDVWIANIERWLPIVYLWISVSLDQLSTLRTLR